MHSEVRGLNINDVAREAGVSKTTVSRVLLGGNKVKPETREKVLEVMKRLNYTPNTSAQMLAKKRNKVIGVIDTLPINDPFFGYMNDVIASECEKYGFRTLYAVGPWRNGTSCEREIAMLYGKVDGYVILGNGCVQKSDVEKLVQLGMPVALFKTGFTCDGALAVDINSVKGGEMAAEYFLKMGYKKIGYVHGGVTQNEFKEGWDRYEGFRDFLQKSGVPLKNEFYGDRTYTMAMTLVEEIIESGVEALFCETDLMAHGIVSALIERQIRIPEQIAVLGFDGIKFRNYGLFIVLSTFEQPLEQMASCIVSSLVNRIENEVPYGKIQLFDAKFVKGRTT